MYVVENRVLLANLFVFGASEGLLHMVVDDAVDEVPRAVVVVADDRYSCDVEDVEALSSEGAEGSVSDGLPCWSVPI